VLIASVAALAIPTAAASAAETMPVLLVTEDGGFAQAAPDRPRLAVYADGLVVRAGEGRVGRTDPAKVAGLLRTDAAVAAAGTAAPADAPCATDLPTATVTVRPQDGPSASIPVYGLGVCSPDAPVSRLFAAADALPLRRVRAFTGPYAAYAVLADSAPGPAARWTGTPLRPGTWVRGAGSRPRLVRSGGHRYALLPRLLLPHERGKAGPGMTAVRVKRLAGGSAPGSWLTDPPLLVQDDGRWYAQDAAGTWQHGSLTPADLDAFTARLDGIGFLGLASDYGGGVGEETLTLAWGRRASVRYRPAAPGLPAPLTAARAAFLGLRPADATPWTPEAVKLRWRRAARPSGPTLAAVPPGRASGATVLVGQAASATWAAVGNRSYAGTARRGSVGYLVAVEPAL
jgi:hypothetical protein